MAPAEPGDDDLDDTFIAARRTVGGVPDPAADSGRDADDDTVITGRGGVADEAGLIAGVGDEPDIAEARDGGADAADGDDDTLIVDRRRDGDPLGRVSDGDPLGRISGGVSDDADHTFIASRRGPVEDAGPIRADVDRVDDADAIDDETFIGVRRRGSADEPDDRTLLGERRRRDPDADDTARSVRASVATGGGIPRSTATPQRERAAGDGTPAHAIYRPRLAEPVRTQRTPPAARAPQQPADTAAQQHSARVSRGRFAALVGGAIALVALVGIAVLVILLSVQ